MVKLSYFLPEASDPVAMKKQLVECGVLDLTNELIFRMAPEAVDPAILSRSSLSIRQYTRSAMKLLKDELLSNNPPFCMSNPRIRMLDIWKPDHPYENSYDNRNSTFRQHPPYRSRSFNDGKRNFTPSNHLMPPFMVRQQKQNTNDKENNCGIKKESVENKTEQVRRDRTCDVKLEIDTLETEEKNVLRDSQSENLDQNVEECSDNQSNTAGQNPTANQQNDDKCLTDEKKKKHIDNSTTSLSKTNTDLGTELTQNTVLNRDDRRIGSGRISLGNEWEYFNKDIDKNAIRTNPQYLGPGDFQMSRQDEERNNLVNKYRNSYRNRRRYDSYSSKSNTSNDEPEWFSAGPTSRLDVIELHGFDDDCSSIASENNLKNGKASALAEKSEMNNKQDEEIASVTTSQSSPPPARSTPTKYGYKKYDNRSYNLNNSRNQNGSKKSEFMFDTFFNPFANSNEDDKTKHRVSSKNESRFPRGLNCDVSDNNLQCNLNPFTPNRNSFNDNWMNNSAGNNSFNRSDFYNNNIRGPLPPRRVPNVEELEAKMFHSGRTNQENLMQMLANMANKQQQNQQYEDKEKFKYLINQMTSANFANKSINFYQDQQQKQFFLIKHQQQQETIKIGEILQQFAAYSLTAVPIRHMNRADIINRPEAKALLQALARHDITVNGLIRVLNESNLPYVAKNPIFEYNRDIILTVLNFVQLQKQHLQQQQQTAMQINSQINFMNNFPVIPPTLPQRVPSTRELQFHTQSILKSALLRKKMEEQKNQKKTNETFGDFMLNSSLISAMNTSSSIYSNNNNNFQQQIKSFTPTAVLKNVNADNNKNDSSIWQKIPPSTELMDNDERQNKFNDNGNSSQSNNFEQPQKHIQWTKPELYKPNNIKSIGRSILKKPTYQTTANDESVPNLQVENLIEFENNQQQQDYTSKEYSNLSPTKNELSKWFTPELLAQASAGKLPSLNKNEVVFLEEFEKNAHQS